MIPNNAHQDDRRKYKRIIFPFESAAQGLFLVPGIGQKPLRASIINLSMGGLYFVPKMGRNSQISIGDKLVFLEINPVNSETLILNIDAEIRWVMDAHILDHIGIGCKFINISDFSRERLKTYIDVWLLEFINTKKVNHE